MGFFIAAFFLGINAYMLYKSNYKLLAIIPALFCVLCFAISLDLGTRIIMTWIYR